LAGNKLDLEANREVMEESAYQYAVSQQVGFFECSAKEMINVAELFNGVVRLIDRQRKTETPSNNSSSSSHNNNNNNAGGGDTAKTDDANGRKKLVKLCVLL
jgi:GTPase SAR1 family protein